MGWRAATPPDTEQRPGAKDCRTSPPVNDGNPDDDNDASDGGVVSDETPDVETADDAKEAYWVLQGDPTDAVDDGCLEWEGKESDGGGRSMMALLI